MKYLLMAVLAVFFVIDPAFAERNDDERDNKSDERYEKRERKKEGKGRKFGRKAPNPWKILQEISSEERKRLSKLHATNPKAWKEEVAKIVKRIRQEKQELNKKIQGLVRQYKSSEDAGKKKEALNQLRKITKKLFLTKMEKNRKRLELLEKHVKKLRQQYDFRQKNADKIIQNRLDTLTSDTKFEW